jgi:hypothetical protein
MGEVAGGNVNANPIIHMSNHLHNTKFLMHCNGFIRLPKLFGTTGLSDLSSTRTSDFLFNYLNNFNFK